jgi:hypothetical protein
MLRLFSLGQPFSGLEAYDFSLFCLVRKWPNPGIIFTLMGDIKALTFFLCHPDAFYLPLKAAGATP